MQCVWDPVVWGGRRIISGVPDSAVSYRANEKMAAQRDHPHNALEGGGVVSKLLFVICVIWGRGLFLLMLYNTLHPRQIFRQTVYQDIAFTGAWRDWWLLIHYWFFSSRFLTMFCMFSLAVVLVLFYYIRSLLYYRSFLSNVYLREGRGG